MILKHRDLELMRFEWTPLGGVHVTSVNEAARQFWPLELKGIITMSRALSLNDVHWVVGEDSKARWADYNLYTNAFSKATVVRYVSQLKKAGRVVREGSAKTGSWKVVRHG